MDIQPRGSDVLATDDTAREKKKDRLAKKAMNTERLRLQDAIAAIYEPRKPPPQGMVTERENLYDFARAQMGDPALVYLEFGVRQGRSMKRMMQRFTNPDGVFYGFDSFEGLPEQWRKMSRARSRPRAICPGSTIPAPGS